MAGSWTTPETNGLNKFDGRAQSMFSISSTFTADASAATVPDWTITVPAAFLTDIGVKFGTTAPDTVTITVKDSDGLTVATETVTASGRISASERPALLSGGTISISGNTTNSATAKVVLYFVGNRR